MTTTSALQIALRHPVDPKRLAGFRELADLTQQVLADELGVTQVTVARWETGTRTPNVAMVQRLATVCLEKVVTSVLPSLLPLDFSSRWTQAWVVAYLGGCEALLRADDWAWLLQFPKRWLKNIPRERIGRYIYIRGDWIGIILEDAVHGNRQLLTPLLSSRVDLLTHRARHKIGGGRLVIELEQAIHRQAVLQLVKKDIQRAIREREDADDE